MGTRSATGKVKLDFQATIANLINSGLTVSHIEGGVGVVNVKFTDGVSADNINRAWGSVSRALTSGASEDLDLYDYAGLDIGAGAGNDALGQTLTMEEIAAILIVQTAGPGRIQIQPSASAGWTPIGIHTVANGGALRVGGWLSKGQPDTSAFDVADGSNHRINISASGGAASYSIYVFGRHDDDESSSSSSSSSTSSSSRSSSSSSTSSSQSSSSTSSSTSTLSSSSSSTSTLSSSTSSSLSSSSSSTLSSSSTSSLSSSSSSSSSSS